MPNVDLSLTITVIIALAAVISPIFVACINNKHQYKLKVLDYDQQLKMKEIEEKELVYERTVIKEKELYYNFLSVAGTVSKCSDLDALKEYGKICPLIMLRIISISPDLYDDLKMFNKLLEEPRPEPETSNLLMERIIPKVKGIIESL